MKAVRYTLEAMQDLKRHGNAANRIRKAIADYAADPRAHANNVKALKGSSALRIRVGDYRIVFVEDTAGIVVTRVGPRGGVYD
jgi:mRNA interferase RelE/StbE